jgi:signal transduction histidine kinase
LNQILEEELTLLHHNLFFKHQIKVKKSFAGSLPKFKGYDPDIRRGLLNLIQNAVESMETSAGKELEIKTVSHGDRVEVGNGRGTVTVRARRFDGLVPGTVASRASIRSPMERISRCVPRDRRHSSRWHPFRHARSKDVYNNPR